MSSIDDRIVRMDLNDSGFQAGATRVLDTLDKLTNALNFKGAADGLDTVQKSINDFDLDNVSNSLDQCSSKFSVFDAFVTGIFLNLGSKAADFGTKLLKSLTIQPAMDGFSEYQLKMNSVQTIMASTGASAKEVGDYLDKLNEYADLTKYSFSDMTANIGKFTNAGVKLDTAVKAIQGISNVAAVAGANTNEASRAMYNFAQALSSGSVKLVDWKSIEYANMATKEFKDSLLMTAEAMGTVVKTENGYVSTTTDASGKISDAFTATSNFNESLSHQWMTTEVLTQTLENYATDVRRMTDKEHEAYREKLRGIGYTEKQIDQFEELGKKAFDSAQDIKTLEEFMGAVKETLGSGWASTWEHIIGDIDQAKELWTGALHAVQDYIMAMDKARNELAEAWVDAGGRTAAINTIKNLFEAMVRPIEAIGTAFSDVFGVSGPQLAQFTKNLEQFAKKLVISDEAAQFLYDVMYDVFTIIHSAIGVLGNFLRIGVQVVSVLWTLAKPFVTLTALIGKTFINILARASSYVLWFTDRLEEMSWFITSKAKKAIELIYSLFGFLGRGIEKLLGYTDAVSYFVLSFVESLMSMAEKSGIIQTISVYISDFANHIYEAFSSVSAYLSGFLGNWREWADVIKELMFSAKDGVKEFGSNFLKQSKKFVTGTKTYKRAQKTLSDFSAKFVPSFTTSLGNFKNRTKDAFTAVLDYFKNLTPEKLLTDVKTGFSKFVGFLETYVPKVSSALMAFGRTVGQTLTDLISGNTSFSGVFDKIKTGIMAGYDMLPDTVKSLFQKLIDAFNYGRDNLTKEAGKLSFVNIADNIKLAWEGLQTLPKTVGDIFDGISETVTSFIKNFPWPGFEELSNIGEKLLKGGLTVAIINFINSVKDLNKTFSGIGNTIINWPKEFGNALARFGEGFNAWKKETKAEAVLKIAAALAILAGSLFLIASIPADDLVRAGQALAVMGAAVGGFVLLIGAMEKLKLINPLALAGLGDAIMGLGVGIAALAAAAWILSKIPADELNKGTDAIVALILSVSIFAAALRGNGKSLKKGAVGMIALAVSVLLFVKAVKKLGEMDPKILEQGIDAFVNLMLAISVFGAIGAKGISSLLSSFLKFGAGVLLLSVGIGVLAASLSIMSQTINEIENLPSVLLTVGGAIAAFAGVCLILKDADPVGVGLGLLAFSAGIMVMSVALAGLSAISWENLGAGAIAIAVFLGIYSNMVSTLNAEDAVATSVAVGIFSAAVLALSAAFGIFNYIDWGQAWNGVFAISGLMLALGLMTDKLNAGDLATTSVSLLTFSAAVLVLAGAFKVLETVDVMSLLPGFMMAVAAFAGFGALATVLSPVAPLLLAVAASMVVFSVAVLGLATAFWVVADAIEKLNNVGPEGVVNTMSAFGDGLGAILDAVIARIPEFLSKLVEGILSAMPLILGAAWEIVKGLVTGIIEHAPELIAAGKALVDKVKEGLAGLVEWFKQHGGKGVLAFISGVKSYFGSVGAAAKTILTKVKTALASLGSNLKTIASTAFSMFVSTITSYGSRVLSAAKRISTNAYNGIKDMVSKFASVGRNAINAIVNNLSPSALYNRAMEIGRSALSGIKHALGIKSPSREFRKVGIQSVMGAILGFADKAGELLSTVKDLGITILETFEEALTEDPIDVGDLLSTNYSPVVTPIIDSATFDSNMGRLSSALNFGSIGNLNLENVSQNQKIASDLSDYIDWNKKTLGSLDQQIMNAIDYDRLGASVAGALVNAGVHVEMDSGELMGYLAGEIRTARRMYGSR